MNWPTSTYLNIRQKLSARFLIVFSFCTLAVAGVIWACADSEEWEYSAFTPEFFVNKQYSPFFYTGNEVYYGLGYAGDSNGWYNEKVTDEWYHHFNGQFARKSLRFLLTTASQGMIDTVYKNYIGALHALPAAYPDSSKARPDKAQVTAFFKYLQLAKSCETFTVNTTNDYGWEKVKPLHAPANLEKLLTNAFQKETDPFIKSRLWFQLVRYYYFRGDEAANAKSVAIFNKYKDGFAKDLTYYRALGYVAGYYYHQKNYALSNYLYSLCYNYSYELKIPSYWSFHPQNETDWKATLRMAKNKDEQITLWQMLGIEFDEGRAMKEIVALDPKSEKLDLLLSRMVNSQEAGRQNWNFKTRDSAAKSHFINKRMIEGIALKNNTGKPYFWNLAAGYINYMDSNYKAAGKFYAIAKKQFPAGDASLQAQSKLLDILLMVKRLGKIDAVTEQQLTEPLNWLAAPTVGKSGSALNKLRYSDAKGTVMQAIARIYHRQGNLLKEACFNNNHRIYQDSAQVENLVKLLAKASKTPFEKVMTRYYPVTLDNLYYHQALNLVYQEQTGKAIVLLKKMKPSEFVLYANPFNSRIVDCHDCDAAAPQKQKFTPLTFVQTLQNLQAEIKAGKNIYRNAWLLANAYYNITYYGNGRAFYQAEDLGIDASGTPFGDASGNSDAPNITGDKFYDMAIATKYYTLALSNAATNEQRARCTFMLSKCDQNDFYNGFDTSVFRELPADSIARYHNKYFPLLKNNYSKTAYYKEVLKECGYFRSYLGGK
ncbi:hypothetical protein ACFGVS_18625 [Mucilaginibacter sp. AW1-7]|uniref:hypothetical protein n=1 Tax=Mucilaginibacter sp. AW1-7 TaxID=3349874 RepID=UPI003F73BCEE